ncbi:hypothetical protein BDR03DRAFT_968177 [Suillus americanus]|nr:hypothetical protein BDR03DRAFT_968177 [Suillus americanus]
MIARILGVLSIASFSSKYSFYTSAILLFISTANLLRPPNLCCCCLSILAWDTAKS